MPVKLKNLDSGLGIMFIGEGNVTGQELIHANEKILSLKEQIEISKYCLIDYSEATGYAVSTSEIEIIANQDKKISKYLPDYTVAIVTKRDIEFGVSRMWESIIQIEGLQWETKVFKVKNDAEQWIKNKAKEKYNIDLSCR